MNGTVAEHCRWKQMLHPLSWVQDPQLISAYKPKPAPAGSLHAADAKAVLHPWVLQGTHRVWGNMVLSANCIKFSRGKSLRNHKPF